jgi:hypothetical protein
MFLDIFSKENRNEETRRGKRISIRTAFEALLRKDIPGITLTATRIARPIHKINPSSRVKAASPALILARQK